MALLPLVFRAEDAAVSKKKSEMARMSIPRSYWVMRL